MEQLKRKKALRADLQNNPSKYVVSGTGKVTVFDKGIINDYTEIKAYPVRNLSEFDVLALEGNVTLLGEGDRVIATLPVQFQGGLLAGEDKLLPVKSSTVQAKARSFRLTVTQVQLRSE